MAMHLPIPMMMQRDIVPKHTPFQLMTTPFTTRLILDHNIQIRLTMDATHALFASALTRPHILTARFIIALQLYTLDMRVSARREVCGLVFRVRRGREFFFGVHVVFGFSLGEAHDERGHGHFDVEWNWMYTTWFLRNIKPIRSAW
jgi:hypothetical protein